MPVRELTPLIAVSPAQVHGLPRNEDRFPYRYRNQLPLAIRQIIDPLVLHQWSSNPQHVAAALIESVKQENSQKQDELKCMDEEETALLPVMVAEDTKNFMDNPQFTKKIHMSAKQIVERVILSPQQQQAPSSLNSSNTPGSDNAACPLCTTPIESTTHQGSSCPSRFYYRGVVPRSLYDDLAIPALLDALALPKASSAFAAAPKRDLMRIWISLAGATTPLHYDRCHGILIQLVGRKRFVVFSHEDTHALYPYDGITGPGHASKVRNLGHCFPFPVKVKADATLDVHAVSSGSYLQHPDQHNLANLAELTERWPRVIKASPWVIDLEPGDALYTPPGFWHEVTSVDNSVSITVPWDMNANELDEVPRHMAF
ncbi:hypothetical protein BGZ94_004222 [Podila epigama]|nr:hypothetical protein BGZ94_004222 [Podila epigama]